MCVIGSETVALTGKTWKLPIPRVHIWRGSDTSSARAGCISRPDYSDLPHLEVDNESSLERVLELCGPFPSAPSNLSSTGAFLAKIVELGICLTVNQNHRGQISHRSIVTAGSSLSQSIS